MGYNPFRWWTKGRPNKPLKAEAPLLLKIRNGDFDYSYMFNEAKGMRESAKEVYELTYKNYGGTDEKNRIESALEASRMASAANGGGTKMTETVAPVALAASATEL